MSKVLDAITLSQELITYESVTPEATDVLDFLEETLKSLGFTCQRLPFKEKGTEKVDNLYARIGEGSPHLCFAGHVDVVPTGPLSEWISPPFEPDIRDDMLYGRGASDMKCAIACFIAAVSEYLQEVPQPCSISLLLTGDEEGPSINGTRKMLPELASQGEKWDACIVGEPTSVEEVGDMIKIGRRGSINFELTVKGKQGHVAYPHLADNPVTRLTNILYTLNQHELDQGTTYFQPSNLEVVSIDVGNPADNVIPNTATARFNIRYNDRHSSKTLIKWVEGLCESICEESGASYKLTHRLTGESFLTEPGKFSHLLEDAIKKVTGKTAELSTTGGTSDARFIKDYCPVVELGLTNATAHKINEHVPVKDIQQLTDIYKLVLEKFSSI